MQNASDPGEPGWAYDGGDGEPDAPGPDGRRPEPTTALSSPAGGGRNLSVRVWHPEPVARPEVDAALIRMPWPERAAEVIRYSTLRLERWLSPNGALREWLRLNLRVGVIALAVALLVVPPVSMLLRGGAEWSALLKSTLLNVSDTVMGMPPIVIALGALLIGGRFFQRRWLGRRRSRPAYREQDPYDM